MYIRSDNMEIIMSVEILHKNRLSRTLLGKDSYGILAKNTFKTEENKELSVLIIGYTF